MIYFILSEKNERGSIERSAWRREGRMLQLRNERGEMGETKREIIIMDFQHLYIG